MTRTLLALFLALTAASLFAGCEAMENSKPYDQGGWVGVPN